MSSFFSIKNLTYEKDNKTYFKDFNLHIEKSKFVSILGTNKSGKSLLTNIISAIIPTNDVCSLNDLSLNSKNVLEYLSKIGVVTNNFNQDFLCKKVKDELSYPLENLGLPEHKINKRITEVCKFFEIEDLLNKNTSDLTLSEKKKLLIIMGLIHNPDILILDDAFYGLTKDAEEFMLLKLQELVNGGLTVLNITSKLDTTYKSSKVYVLNNFKIKKEGSLLDILNNDTFLRKIGIEIPIVVDISIKLKFYGLISKIYFDIN